MNEVTASETKWIETYLVPEVAKSLGKESGNVRYKISFPENCFFLSYVCFLNVIFGKPGHNNEAESDDTLRLVVKKLPLNASIVAHMNMTTQFHNEIVFYRKFARGNLRFPRCIYMNDKTPEDTVIVTENISTQGYNVCPQIYNIPLEYVFAAVNEIGKFHAISYVMKEHEPEKFYNIVSDIQDPRFNENGWMGSYVNVIATRPIDWLRNVCDKEFCDRMERHLGNGYKEIILDSIKPVEPLATICHGDFTSNNIFFRNNDGKLEAMLFDFALICYSSPAIDLSTFLYLNCSAKDRKERFDDIYRSYHDTLIKHLRNAGIDDLEKYSYDKMLSDYKRRATFGYMIAIFYLPVIRGVCSVALDDLFNDLLDSALRTKESGGEAMTELFGKMILELRDLGCLDHVH